MNNDFDAVYENIHNGRCRKYTISGRGKPLTTANVCDLWMNDADFRSFYIDILRNSPFAVYRWETPPATRSTVDLKFEFVIIEAPEFAYAADHQTFSEYFIESPSGNGVVTFPNLGRDALLIVPLPVADNLAYRHLAAFMRNGPEAQKHALWQTVGQVMLQHLCEHPVWLNTASGGVAWLHVRLDSYPKYYAYGPYRDMLHKA